MQRALRGRRERTTIEAPGRAARALGAAAIGCALASRVRVRRRRRRRGPPPTRADYAAFRDAHPSSSSRTTCRSWRRRCGSSRARARSCAVRRTRSASRAAGPPELLVLCRWHDGGHSARGLRRAARDLARARRRSTRRAARPEDYVDAVERALRDAGSATSRASCASSARRAAREARSRDPARRGAGRADDPGVEVLGTTPLARRLPRARAAIRTGPPRRALRSPRAPRARRRRVRPAAPGPGRAHRAPRDRPRARHARATARSPPT